MKVLNSDNPDSFNQLVKALKTPHPFLHNQLVDKLSERCVIVLINDLVNDQNNDNWPGFRDPDEHDENCDDDVTRLKQIVSVPAGSVAANKDDKPPQRQTQSVKMRAKRRPKLSNADRQTAFDRISRERQSRGLPPLDDSNPDDLRQTLICEFSVRVQMRKTSLHRQSSRDFESPQDACGDSPGANARWSKGVDDGDNTDDDEETLLKEFRNSGVEISAEVLRFARMHDHRGGGRGSKRGSDRSDKSDSRGSSDYSQA